MGNTFLYEHTIKNQIVDGFDLPLYRHVLFGVLVDLYIKSPEQ